MEMVELVEQVVQVEQGVKASNRQATIVQPGHHTRGHKLLGGSNREMPTTTDPTQFNKDGIAYLVKMILEIMMCGKLL